MFGGIAKPVLKNEDGADAEQKRFTNEFNVATGFEGHLQTEEHLLKLSQNSNTMGAVDLLL